MSQYVRSDSSVTTFMVRVLYRNGYRNTGPVKMHSGAKIYFIHFNHTNPLLKKISVEKDKVRAAGFTVAEEGLIIEL